MSQNLEFHQNGVQYAAGVVIRKLVEKNKFDAGKSTLIDLITKQKFKILHQLLRAIITTSHPYFLLTLQAGVITSTVSNLSYTTMRSTNPASQPVCLYQYHQTWQRYMCSSSSLAFSLSPSLITSFLHKLVAQVNSSQYVEMRKLFTNNITLLNLLESTEGNTSYLSLPGLIRLYMRDISSIVLWLYYYMAYIAMCTTAQLQYRCLHMATLLLKGRYRVFLGYFFIDS